MPSHIFLQLGMWQDVVNSNIEAYNAAVTVNKKFGLAEGREDFHTLSWLAYANLMLGQFDKASDNLGLARAALDRNPDSTSVHNGYLNMRGRHVLETGQWEDVGLAGPETPEGSHANWVSVVGMSAAHLGRNERAEAAIKRLAMIRARMESAGRAYDAKKVSILEKEVLAVLSLESGDDEKAIAAAREAAETEMHEMQAPSGPPDPIKPAVELYADILLASGRPAEARATYERSLQWIPGRTPSVTGLEKAAAAAGRTSL
jgi:tetratricopeptide (TPR) repeat protein